jgi:chemotaxis protein MotB
VARKKQHGDEHPDERWLLTYADMITLLMALFIVMFAMALVDQTRFDTLKATLKETFSGPVLTGSDSILDTGSDPTSQRAASELSAQGSPIEQIASIQAAKDARANRAREQEQLSEAAKKVQAAARRAGLEKNVETKIDERGLVIRLITDDVLFPLGSWVMQPAAQPLLSAITPTLEHLPNTVRVEGHTDSLPCSCPLGNQGLSGMRAGAVLAYMEAVGFDAIAHETGASGYAARVPLQRGNGSNPHNRRVEIVVVRRYRGENLDSLDFPA